MLKVSGTGFLIGDEERIVEIRGGGVPRTLIDVNAVRT